MEHTAVEEAASEGRLPSAPQSQQPLRPNNCHGSLHLLADAARSFQDHPFEGVWW